MRVQLRTNKKPGIFLVNMVDIAGEHYSNLRARDDAMDHQTAIISISRFRGVLQQFSKVSHVDALRSVTCQPPPWAPRGAAQLPPPSRRL
jgi:hypothetical protein